MTNAAATHYEMHRSGCLLEVCSSIPSRLNALHGLNSGNNHGGRRREIHISFKPAGDYLIRRPSGGE